MLDMLAAAVAATMKQSLNALPPERTDRVRELIQLISNAYPATLPGEEVEYLLALLSCLHAAIADVTGHTVAADQTGPSMPTSYAPTSR
jgi:hypothetical protein